MTQRNLKKLPSLLTQSPWLALCAVVLFAAGVLLFELRNVKSETTFASTLTTEKGNALITILENAIQSESVIHWDDNALRAFIKNIGSDKNLHFLALVDAQGNVLLGTGDLPAGAPLWQSPPAPALVGAEIRLRDKQHFRVSRRIETRGNASHSNAQHTEEHKDAQPVAMEDSLWAVADYNAQPIADARSADRLHLVIIALVLLFLALLGGITWYLVRRHLRSQQIVQETTAFSSHILRNLPIGIIATDKDYGITSINAEAARIIGRPSDTRYAPGLHGTEAGITHPFRLPPAWSSLMTGLHNGAPVLDVEMRYAFEDNRPIPLSVSASALSTEAGQHLGYVFIVRDLGEIRHLQAEVRRRDRLAALGTLAAGIAHEVRNPLSAIRGIARYFEESHPAGSEEEALSQTLGQEVLRLDKVVSGLLDFARPDILLRTPVPLDTVLEGARRMVVPALEEHGVEFAAHIPVPAPVVLVDSDRLAQVLINLFLNAVDAMRQSVRRNLTVRVALETNEAESVLVVEVEDTGCGIPPEKMQDIFSPYYTTKPRGSGLGLAIVHKIVEAHEGVIEARNSRHGGCIMTVRLPLTSGV